jgi:hypothetical protein
VDSLHDGSTQSSAMVRVQIQPLHRTIRCQRDRQIQLCVPLVEINGPSYRLKNRLASMEENTEVA